jgi:hypothetical protein
VPEVLAQEQRTGAFACVLRTDPTPEERDAEEEIDLGTPMVEKSRLLKEVDFLLGNLGVLSTLEPSRCFHFPERQPVTVLQALHARSYGPKPSLCKFLWMRAVIRSARPSSKIKGPNEPLISLCLTLGPDRQLAGRISSGKNQTAG